MRILKMTINAADDGKKVKQLMRGAFQISSSLLKSLKWRENAILLNGQSVNVATIVHAGDELTVNIDDNGECSPHIAAVDYPLDILYEDDDLLIINKPAGIAVHSATLTEEIVTIAGAVAHYLGNAPFHPVNRLDRGVTGVMVVAKNGYMHQRCMAFLHTDDFHREYRGICEGTLSPNQGTIDLPIGRDPDSVLKRCIDSDGLASHTEYEVLQTSHNRSLLRLRPLTGRTHQLRLHLSAIGHPLIGDWLYGTESRELITRPALHSYELWLRHPLSGELLHIIAPIPDDMQKLL